MLFAILTGGMVIGVVFLGPFFVTAKTAGLPGKFGPEHAHAGRDAVEDRRYASGKAGIADPAISGDHRTIDCGDDDVGFELVDQSSDGLGAGQSLEDGIYPDVRVDGAQSGLEPIDFFRPISWTVNN